MLFLKSLTIWFLTVLTGSLLESLFIGGSEIWDAFIPSFLLLALFGGILSSPSILINWFGLYTALSFKSSFDRLMFLGMVNIMANLAVLAIILNFRYAHERHISLDLALYHYFFCLPVFIGPQYYLSAIPGISQRAKRLCGSIV